VSLASPQNPSGVSIPKQKIHGILGAMTECCPDAYLLLDETYREAAYGIDSAAASAIGLSSKVISVSSLSKCHGAPGLRLGWAITRDAALRRQLVLGKFNTVISCSPVDEALGLQVLAQQEQIIAERRRRLADGLAKTADWVLANADLIEWVRPDAGALCCVRLRPSVFDDVAVSRFYDVLAAAGIGVADGRWFGDEARVFRLGFGFHPMPVFQTALDALATALRRTARAAA
jgi:aspartate/methionine/tyrosine aminotransferase